MANTSRITVSPREMKDILRAGLPNKMPVLIKGAPGVGKSDIVAQVVDELEYEILLTHPVVSDPTDYKGLPMGFKDKNGEMVARFLPFGDLAIMLEAKVPTVVFIDDLGQAPAVVQAACMQLILARRVNGHKVSDKVVFLAATNRREDKAGVTGILEPVKSRFAAILELEPTVDDWIEWALQHEMPPEIIGWVNWRKMDVLMGWKATADIINGSCPRTIANAGRWISIGQKSIAVLAGAIGEGAASDLTGFLRVYEQLPNIDAILQDGSHGTVPKDPSALYAVTSALVCSITKGNAEQVIKYGNRMPVEYCTLLVRDAIRKDGSIQKTKAFTDWCRKHQNVLL